MADGAMDVASIAYDVATGDYASAGIDAVALALPGVNALVLPKMDRVKMFINNLQNAPAVSNVDEAISLINRTLDDVEDMYSGILKSPNAISMPNIDDGRMYGILDNKYVKVLEDGTTRAFTRKNTIIFDTGGGFNIYVRDRNQPNQIGKLILSKSGSGK